MDILTTKIVKIRKSHNCWGCMRKFDKGEEMQYIVAVDDGEFNSVYWCEECQEFIRTLSDWEKEDGFAFGELLNSDDHQEIFTVHTFINKR